MIENILVLLGSLIIFLGLLILVLGAFFQRNSDSERLGSEKSPEIKSYSELKGGGVIMLGPIPIIFGSDGESAKTAAILAIVIMLIALVMFRGRLPL